MQSGAKFRPDLTRPASTESDKSRAWRACVLTCLACLRAHVLGVLACSRTYVLGVLTCFRAHVRGVFTCLRAHVLGVLTCLRACMYTLCLRASYDACFACLPLAYSRFCLIIYFVCINQGFAIKRKLLIHVNLS